MVQGDGRSLARPATIEGHAMRPGRRRLSGVPRDGSGTLRSRSHECETKEAYGLSLARRGMELKREGIKRPLRPVEESVSGTAYPTAPRSNRFRTPLLALSCTFYRRSNPHAPDQQQITLGSGEFGPQLPLPQSVFCQPASSRQILRQR